METHGHITLNGKQYRIDPSLYRMADQSDFSPRASVPGGSQIFGDLLLYQPLLQTSWQHGFGFQWNTDAMGYLRTDGCLDTRHSGIVVMFASPTSSDTDNNAKEGGTIFKGSLYTWGTDAVRKYTTTWAEARDGDCNFLLATSTYLFAFPNGARVQKSTDGATWSDTGVDANAADYKWAAIHAGKVFAGEDGNNYVHYATESDLSDLEGDDETDVSVIRVGQGDWATIGGLSYAGNFYVYKPDGLWQIGDDYICKCVLDYRNEASTANFRSVAIHNGYVIFPIRDHLFQWNGVRVADITPPRISDEWPYTTYGSFDNLVAVNGYLYLSAKTNETTANTDLLCYDGVGWHRLCNLCTGSDTVSGMWYDVQNNRLWYHKVATADATYYIQFQSNSDFIVAGLPTTGNHYLYTSRLDAGYRRIIKSSPSLLIGASNLTTARYIKVAYSLDGDDYTEWGTVTENGITELTEPDNLYSIEYNYIIFRLQFVTDNAAQSPVLEDMCLRLLLRPDEFYGYSMTIIGAPRSRGDSRTPKAIVADLKAARASKSPVSFTDIHGEEHQVYVTSLTEHAVENDPEAPGEGNDWEVAIQLNLVQV